MVQLRTDDRLALVAREVLAPVARWTPQKKFDLCIALKTGVVTIAAARTAHGLSDEELLLWLMAFDADGIGGLAATGRKRKAAA